MSDEVTVRQRFDAALGMLGLHNYRYISLAGAVELSVTSVSLAELEKLAARAEHLVELERAVHDWYVADTESPSYRPFNIGTVIEWARAHDFSMLDESP